VGFLFLLIINKNGIPYKVIENKKYGKCIVSHPMARPSFSTIYSKG
jgi:hypothetical protein